MARQFWCIGAVLVACGGSGTPAESPEHSEAMDAESAESAESAGTEQEAASGSEHSDSGTVARSDTAAATSADVQAVLQLVIDDEELNPYLHLDRADRFPVRIAGELPAGLELTKATQPVQIVDASEAKGKPVIVFTEIEVGSNSAGVRYRYDVEKVRGACTLEKRDGRWILKSSRVTVR